jgi:murein DD-endopeptidase MepM/ murein hydrolase activator NlpD
MTLNRRAGLLVIFFSLIVISAFLILFYGKRKPGQKEVAPIPEMATSPRLKALEETIRPGQTVAEILAEHGFTPAEVHQLKEDVHSVYNLTKIIAGHKFRLFASPQGEIEILEYDIDGRSYLQIHRAGDRFRGKVKEYPFEAKVEMIWGIIEDYPISAFQKLNESDYLALALAELFAWDIDFYVDLRQGDSFKLIFEKNYVDGELAGYGNILAAEFINQGKTFQAFRFVYPDSKKADYFDAQGNSLRKEFLISPIKFGRITSRFSLSRLHPIRKIYRAHYGVDYAAPIGTEVQATADGSIISAGWNGAAGRMVRIRHKNDYETMYLHLQSIQVKVGDKVKSGDIIGKVGSSGESTGPHLDYRVKHKGSYVNPRGWRFQPVEPLRAEFREGYQQIVKNYSFVLRMPQLLFSRLAGFWQPLPAFSLL